MGFIAVVLALTVGALFGIIITGYGFFELLDDHEPFQQFVIDHLKDRRLLK